MNKKLVLIDGHSILHRAFYGIPILSNSQGVYTNAVYGFLNIMFSILDEECPDYLAVAFDMHAPTFRHKIFAEYKGTRKPMPEEMRPQVQLIKDVLKSMNILIMEYEGLEADDLIGSAAFAAANNGIDVVIVSGDRDLLQLSRENILVRIPKTKNGKTEIENYYPVDVMNKYQVSPQGIVDLKSLMGDASDNIPGVPSIGEKTATKLLVEYNTLDNIYAHLSEITPPRAKKALEEHEDLARLSYTLATIKTDAAFGFKIENAAIKDFYNDNSFQLFKELEFKKLLNRFDSAVTAHAVNSNNINIIKPNLFSTVYLNNLAVSGNVIAIYPVKKEKYDFPLQALLNNSEFDGLGVTTKEGSAYFEFDNSLTIDVFQDILINWLNSECVVVLYGLQQLLHKIDIADEVLNHLYQIFDTKLAYYEINPVKSEYSVRDVGENYGNAILAQFETESEKGLYGSYGLYNAYENMANILKEKELDNVYYNIDLPLAISLYDLEHVGVMVKADELKSYSDKLGKEIDEISSEIYEEVGEEFNINSPKQLGVILFEKLGLPGGKKTKTGYSTKADLLEKLALDYPIINKILKYRTLSKLKSTYADGLQNFVKEDGRIHGKFHQTITATGRISSSDPNLQNIPIRMAEGREIRKVFVPKEGFTFIDADYSQIELRILAHMSGDENLINDFKEGKDIHKATASKAFNIPFDEVTELDRRRAKAVNFGIVYGMSAFGLGEDLGISRKEAGSYIEKYFATYPKVKEFLDYLVEFAHKNSYVKTLNGRIRPIEDINNSNFMRRSFSERVAMNSPIQGTAADIMKIAMYNVYKRLKDENLESRVIIQIHDELLVETKLTEINKVKTIIKEEMMGAANLSVPLLVDIGEGDNWLMAH